MKAIPGLTLYYQVYYVKHQDEVAFCSVCEDVELLVDCVDDEVNFAFCPDCHSTFYRDQILWKDAEKDGEHNPPSNSEDYHTVMVVQQGTGHWANPKYRTWLKGAVDEHDRLLTLIRDIKPLTAATLIEILEDHRTSDESGDKNEQRTNGEISYQGPHW